MIKIRIKYPFILSLDVRNTLHSSSVSHICYVSVFIKSFMYAISLLIISNTRFNKMFSFFPKKGFHLQKHFIQFFFNWCLMVVIVSQIWIQHLHCTQIIGHCHLRAGSEIDPFLGGSLFTAMVVT